MRRLELAKGVLVTLTDAVPPPALLSYSFPDARPADHPETVARWLPDGSFRTRFAVFAFVRAGRIMLVDAGLGAEPSPYFQGLGGRLAEEMEAARLDPAAVDLVVFTHFHLDHVGWATRPDSEPFFANACHVAPAAELAHWRQQGDRAALPHHVEAYGHRIAPLLRAARLHGAEGGTPLAALGWPDVSYRAVPGHTVGHHAVVIDGGSETILIAGDAWHSPAQIEVPAWCHRADREPAEAQRSRESLAAWACDVGALVAAGHFPEDHTFGRIVRDRVGGFAFAPVEAANERC